MAVLKILEALPEGFLEVSPKRLYSLLGGPSLIHLPGAREPALFISIMLHGNEPTGLAAVQALLRKYQGKSLPRALSIFVGNVEAAEQGLRRLDNQNDFNRVWGIEGQSPEHLIASQVVDEMRNRGVFASIDVHNNTGLNPHYACINRLGNAYLQLASMFGRTVVYFTKPAGVQSLRFADFCPAVTLECGQPGQQFGVEHAYDYIDACLNLSEVPNHPVAAHDINVFHTVAIVKVPETYSFCYGNVEADLQFYEDVDHFNFSELTSGTVLGRQINPEAKLLCMDEHGNDVSGRYFHYVDGKITLAQPVMPSMLTLNERVVRQDCFCYLMERMELTMIDDSHVAVTAWK